jgi:hypothetical protein
MNIVTACPKSRALGEGGGDQALDEGKETTYVLHLGD